MEGDGWVILCMKDYGCGDGIERILESVAGYGALHTFSRLGRKFCSEDLMIGVEKSRTTGPQLLSRYSPFERGPKNEKFRMSSLVM